MECRLMGVRELNARRRPSAVLEDFIYDGLVCLASPEGVGKSFLAIHVGVYVAAAAVDKELKWNGKWINPGSVVYCAAEGLAGLSTRILTAMHDVLGAGDGWRIRPDDVPFYVVDAPLDICELGHVDTLTQAIYSNVVAKPDSLPVRLIVLDTLSRYMPGHDENKQQDMGAFIHGCDLLRKEFDCAVMPLHHFSKGENSGPRGSSVLTGAADQILWTDAEKGNIAGQVFKWTTEGKNGKWKEGEPLVQHFKAFSVPERDIEGHIVIETKDDGDPWVPNTLVIRPSSEESALTLSIGQKEIVELLENSKNPQSLTSIARSLGKLAPNVLHVLQMLEARGYVAQDTTTKAWKVRKGNNPWDVS